MGNFLNLPSQCTGTIISNSVERFMFHSKSDDPYYVLVLERDVVDKTIFLVLDINRSLESAENRLEKLSSNNSNIYYIFSVLSSNLSQLQLDGQLFSHSKPIRKFVNGKLIIDRSLDKSAHLDLIA